MKNSIKNDLIRKLEQEFILISDFPNERLQTTELWLKRADAIKFCERLGVLGIPILRIDPCFKLKDGKFQLTTDTKDVTDFDMADVLDNHSAEIAIEILNNEEWPNKTSIPDDATDIYFTILLKAYK